MWTFLGIASFTYLYKKSDSVLSLAPRELLLAALLFLSAGLLLSYIRYFHHLKLLQLPLSLLSCVPVLSHLVPQTSSQSSDKPDSAAEKVRQIHSFPP